MNDTLKLILSIVITLVAALGIAAIVFVIVLRKHQDAKRKKIQNYGRRSEERIDALLKKAFGENAVLSGVYLPYPNAEKEKHAEIDHIVAIKSGVFVIEVKSHNGQIRCPDEHDWWQTYNEKKIRFYNPIRQNGTHVRIVQSILKSEGQYNVPVVNVVVFTSNRVTFTQSWDNVVRTDELVNYIRKNGRKDAVSPSQLGRIRSIIRSHAVSGEKVEEKHRRQMQKYRH